MLGARPPAPVPLEIWAGVECTVNRIGEKYLDQLELNGHAQRLSDLDLFASLKIKTLRYPVLWERTQPERQQPPDWSWADERLLRLRELGIRPIVGLVHHGSGPRHTHLLDDSFAEGLAEYARAFAIRYPWVQDYTPVNEPLTTARFSGLYGHWYPHARDPHSFGKAMLNQCRAIVLAMRAIREVNPQARLIQTEDLGKTYATRSVAYQARFENYRRWLTWDLLLGQVDRQHPLSSYLIWAGIDRREIGWFRKNTCPPDLIGINYYVTSERFLDKRWRRYPRYAQGGNGRDLYADIEAVRVRAEGIAGPGMLLREAWERYGLPLAVTEVHLGCSREEQIRWLVEVWNAAQAERQRGANILAVTAWSLLGSYDWDSLLTCHTGRYEPGVFDLRAPAPRPTALAHVVRQLATGKAPNHPVLDSPGWWHRPERLLFPPAIHAHIRRARSFVAPPVESVDLSSGTALPKPVDAATCRTPGATTPATLPATKIDCPLLITGATGTLGQALARLCRRRGLVYQLVSRREMDIADPHSVEQCLFRLKPWGVINAAGFVRVEEAERNAASCFRENTAGPATLAAICSQFGVELVTFSSDLVFDGSLDRPYRESDPVKPLSVYGQSKAAAERCVLRAMPGAIVVRTSAFFGPWDQANFVTRTLQKIAAGQDVFAADDAIVSPTYVPDLAQAVLDLLLDQEQGVWHLASNGATSWYTFAQRAVELAGYDISRVQPCSRESLGLQSSHPRYSVLGSERGPLLPSLEDALARYFAERETTPLGI